MKRGEREREARKVPLLPFLIHGFHAAAVSRTTLKFSRLSHVRGGEEKTKKKLNKSHPLSQPTTENCSESKFEPKGEGDLNKLEVLEARCMHGGAAPVEINH